MAAPARYSDEEISRLLAAAAEFTKPGTQSVDWTSLFQKHEFPGRAKVNVKNKYHSLRKKRARLASGVATAAGSAASPAKKKQRRSQSTPQGGFTRFFSHVKTRVAAQYPEMSHQERKAYIRAQWDKLDEKKKLCFTRKPARAPPGSKKTRELAQLALSSDIHIPRNKVRRVWRLAQTSNTTNEAIAVAAKSTEMFLMWLADRAQKVSRGRRKLIIDDLVTASKTCEESRFLRVALFDKYRPRKQEQPNPDA